MPVKPLQSFPWVANAKKTSGGYSGGPPKGLLHATIVPSDVLPGYNNQGYAPHATFLWDPVKQIITPYQHYYWSNFAKALANLPGGVETNRDTVLQTELAGYIGSTTPKGEFDILEAPNTYWEQVADLMGPVYIGWGVKEQAPRDWTSKGRMSLSQWDAYSGLMAHVHAPENNHWDLPLSALTVNLLMSKIWGHGNIVASPPPVLPPVIVFTKPPLPTTIVPKFPLPAGHAFGPKTGPSWQHSGYYSATDRAGLRTWQAQMRKRGWNISVDGLYGTETGDVAAQFQREKGLTADRLIGKATWDKAWTSPIT